MFNNTFIANLEVDGNIRKLSFHKTVRCQAALPDGLPSGSEKK